MPEKYRVQEIPLDSIIIEEQSLRYDPEDEGIIELAADIQRRGLLQLPGVEQRTDGKFQLLWGGRRLAAHVRLRRLTMFARIYERGDDSVKTVALIENIQRRNLTLEEECDAVNHLHHLEQLSPAEIGIRLSKSRDWVLRRLSIPQMPAEIREPLLEGGISLAAAEELCRVEDESARRYLLQHTISTKPTVSQLREQVQVFISSPSIQDAVDAGERVAQQQHVPSPIYFECAACKRRLKPEHLILIRVCNDACQGTYDEKENNDHAH